MNVEKLGVAALRFYALVLVVSVLRFLPTLLAGTALRLEESGTAYGPFWYQIGSLGTALVTVVLAVLLLWQAPAIARRLARGAEGGDEAKTALGDLGPLAFSLAGLIIFVEGLTYLAKWVVEALQQRHEQFPYYNYELLAATGVMLLCGLWLMVGSRGLLRLIRKLQRPAPPPPAREEAPPAA